MRLFKVLITMLAYAFVAFSGMSTAHAGAIHDAGLFTNTFAGNDDGSVGPVSLGFNINFYGNNYGSGYVNNNGNLTFSSALGTYTPFGITSNSIPMLAPFFADVDTRAGNVVTYGTGLLNSHNVFGINWIDVGYYGAHTDLLNSFQLIIVDRSDTGAGNFDFEFNYNAIAWNTGDASGGSQGRGGTSAAAGWTNGNGTYFQFNGSLVDGALLDGGSNSLIAGSLNSSTPGQYVFQVRNGQVVPEPSELALFGISLLALIAVRRKSH